jgi:hypothetical protein
MPVAPTFAELASDPLPVLEGFVLALKRYGHTWDEVEAQLRREDRAAELAAVRTDRKEYDDEVERIEDGFQLLTAHPALTQCFSWMNEAMGRAIKLQRKSFDGWHLFQLGFLLTQVRAVYERHSQPGDRVAASDVVDVLWFATGVPWYHCFRDALLKNAGSGLRNHGLDAFPAAYAFGPAISASILRGGTSRNTARARWA